MPRKYLVTLLLFGAIFVALLVCCAPDVSWASQNIDVYDFLYSCTTFNVLHAPGAPLYVVLGWLATRLPGNDAWNLAFFLSVIPTMVTCGLIFYVVRKKTTNALAPYLATVAFAGSQIAFSQAVIPEIYSLQCALIVLTYVLFEASKPKLALLSLGSAMCVSWGAVILFPLFVWRYWSRIKLLRYSSLIGLTPLLLYLYIPIANRPPHLSLGPTGAYELLGYMTYHPGTLLNLPIWELPQRFGEGTALVLASLGICGVLAVLALRKREHRTLLWLCIPGVVFYLTTRGPDAFVQLVPALAFASIAVGTSCGPHSLPRKLHALVLAAIVCSTALLGLNAWNYDIGRTLDPTPTAASQMLAQLDQVPDDSWVVAVHDPSYAGIYYYNLKMDRNLKGIHPLFTDPENAQYWEKERIGNLIMPEVPFDIHPDPALISTWSVGAMQVVGMANPEEDLWLVTYSGDRSRLEAGVVYIDVNTEPPVVSDGAKTSWWEYLTVYPYVYKYVSGGYMMNTEWRTGTSTNLTVGLFGLLFAFGGVLGYYLPKKVYARLPSKRRSLVTVMTTATMAMLFCYVLALCGIPGFRFGG